MRDWKERNTVDKKSRIISIQLLIISLNIKSEGITVVAGKKITGPSLLPNNALVISGSVTFSLEPAPARLGM